MKSSQKSKKSSFDLINPDAAGIDIGSQFHVVAVSAERDPEPVRTFKSFTGDLYRLADWLEEVSVTSVVMESTGIYWIPVFEILQSRGFEVVLANAREAKQVPGRKTDVRDAQWLQQLHQYGLLRGSFHPTEDIATLRSYMRQRERLLDYAAAHIQHMQKALMQMNVQLHHVVSDITGATGMRIIHAIVDGNHNPAELAQFRDVRCKASEDTICKALQGHYREEHLFALRQALELYDFYQAHVAECDREIESVLGELHCPEPPETPLPKPRHRTKQPNALSFDVRQALYAIVGTDLTQIHGMGPSLALKLISECGTDMTRWRTSKHFTSWLCLSPGSKISGGKILSSKTRRSSNRATALLRLAAVNVGKTQTAMGAFYRRLSARIGKAKAVTATARKLAIQFYNTLRYGQEYCDPGVDYYEKKYQQRVIKSLERRAKQLGMVVLPENELAEVS